MLNFKGLFTVIFINLLCVFSLAASECPAQVYKLASKTYANGSFPRVLAVGFHSAEVAEFQPGSADEILRLEAELSQKGVAAIVLVSPTDDDLAKLTSDKGFHYGPLFTTWHKTVRSLEDEIALRTDLTDAERKKKTSDYTRKLSKSEKFLVSVEQLTEENFDDFFKVYMETTVTAGVTGLGSASVAANHAKADGATKGNLENWRVILIRDPAETNLVVGGLLVELIPSIEIDGLKGIAKIKTAGYSKEEAYEKAQLSHRAQHELRKLALTLGMQIFSYGSDPNFFGEMSSVGLASYKRVSGFTPLLGSMYPGPLGVILGKKRILKILKPENFRNPKTGIEQYLTFEFSEGDKLKPVLSGEFPADYVFKN